MEPREIIQSDIVEPLSRWRRLWVSPVWKAIKRLFKPQVRIVTGGIAFYALFSIFPLIYLTLSLMGILLPEDLAARLAQPVGRIISQGIEPLSGAEIAEIQGVTPTGMTLRVFIALLIVLFTATSGAKAAITGIRMIAGTTHKTGIFKFQGVSLLLTGAMIFAVWLLGFMQLIVATANSEVQFMSDEVASLVATTAGALQISKLIASFIIFYVIIGLSLRGHIHGKRAKAAGAVTAALAWIALTFLFQLYLRYSVLDTLYGALASVILGFIWLSSSVSCLLLGSALAVEWSYAWDNETSGQTVEAPEVSEGVVTE